MILVVVIVIGGAYLFTRYVVGGRNFRSFGLSQQREKLRVLAQTRIGKDQFLTVAQAGPKYLLLGVTPQSISMLAELSREEAAQWLPDPDGGEGSKTPDFRTAFFDTLQQRKKR